MEFWDGKGYLLHRETLSRKKKTKQTKEASHSNRVSFARTATGHLCFEKQMKYTAWLLLNNLNLDISSTMVILGDYMEKLSERIIL